MLSLWGAQPSMFIKPEYQALVLLDLPKNNGNRQLLDSLFNQILFPMSFYGKPLSHRKIELDASATSSSSPEVRKRLDRIDTNYSRLDVLLSELEAQFDLDDRRMANSDKDANRSNILPNHPR